MPRVQGYQSGLLEAGGGGNEGVGQAHAVAGAIVPAVTCAFAAAPASRNIARNVPAWARFPPSP